MKRSASLLSLLLAAAIALPTWAANPDPDAQRLSDFLEKKTGVKPQSVQKMPMLGLYEVIANQQLLYMDKTARYVFVGHIHDSTKKINITAERLKELNKVKWATLPLQDAIKVVYGKGERRIAVFTDVNCSYCRQLEQSLEQVGNVTVYNFIHPVLNSRDTAKSIFCSKDPVKAWKAYMKNGTIPEPPVGKCDDSALDRNLLLGHRFGVSGTPMMIFNNGSMQAGALPPEELERRLNEK